MTYPYPSRNRQIAILIVVSAVVLITGVIALNTVILQNATNVQTVDVAVYWDSNRTDEVSLIDWGSIGPGEAKNLTVYIVNTGDSSVLLAKNTTNWSSSSASDYITLSWDYSSQRINPGQMLETTITLALSPNIEGVTSFSFDLTITAIG